MIQLQQSNMEVILKSSVDVNANVFKEGYWGQNGASVGIELEVDSDYGLNSRNIAQQLEDALRLAKREHLQTSEVLLPSDLLIRIARDILLMAETEPCGVRGALIILHFENSFSSSSSSQQYPINSNSTNNNQSSTENTENNNLGTTTKIFPPSSNSTNIRKIGSVKCDPQTVTTFELHLGLREDLAPWYSRLPQILRNLTKGSIVVSPAYTLAKKKLYRSH